MQLKFKAHCQNGKKVKDGTEYIIDSHHKLFYEYESIQFLEELVCIISKQTMTMILFHVG